MEVQSKMSKKDKPKLKCRCILRRIENNLPEYEITIEYSGLPLDKIPPRVYSARVLDNHYVLTYHERNLNNRGLVLVLGVQHTASEADTTLLALARCEFGKLKKSLSSDYTNVAYLDKTALRNK